MNQNRPLIDINETTTEYLVFVPYTQKERAKAIEGRQWDGQRKCWVYPKTKRVLNELIAEFGDDVPGFAGRQHQTSRQSQHAAMNSRDNGGATPRQPAVKATTTAVDDQLASKLEARFAATMISENEGLRDELAKLQTQIERLATPRSESETVQVARLKAELKTQQQETTKLREELFALRREKAEVEDKVTGLKLELERMERAQKSVQYDEVHDFLKIMALEATGGDDKFRTIMNRYRIDRTLPINLVPEIVAELKTMLSDSTPNRDLYGLITEARDQDLLPPEAIKLAHLIRKQRNMIAHGEAYDKTISARVMLCLFAAALLWPEFPEE